MTRYCYQIHSHRDPEQIYRLVHAIAATSTDPLIVVSHTQDGPPLDRRRLATLGEVVVHLTEGGYADWSHTRRYLEVVDLLRCRTLRYDWMVNVTGQDYPLRPLRDAERELADCDLDGFVGHFAVREPGSPWGRSLAHTRYWFHHRTLLPLSERNMERLQPLQVVNATQPLFRLTVSRGLSFGWRVRTPFGPALECYGGGSYASVRRDCAEYALDFARRRPDVVAHYARCMRPAESYLQTAWLNAGFRFVDNNRRYIDWRGSRFGHPRFLTAADIDVARNSGAHFARKWDMARDPGAFDILDRYLLAENNGAVQG